MSERFSCTPAGGIAAGRRRLRLLLLGPAGLMAAVGLGAFATGRWTVGVLTLLVALVAFVAWRMSGERMPLWLAFADRELVVRTRTAEPRLELTDARARRLDDEERRYLERLASAGGVVAPSGGFDSTRLGEFELFASDLANAVLIETEERRWVVTPDQPDRFLAVFSRTIAHE